MKFVFIILIFLTSIADAQSLVSTQVLLSQAGDFGDVMSGGDTIGGGDSVDTRKHTAWFYGSQPIETCFHVSANFGMNSNSVEKVVRESIDTWKNYFKSKKIGESLSSDQQINTNFKLKQNCEGGEDLVLYFGTGPIFGNLKDLQMRQTLSRPVAYVNKTHMTRDFKWSKGYVRFVEPHLYAGKPGQYFPDWSLGKSFTNLVLHEFGHVLGFVHADGTVMRKDVSKLQFFDGETAQLNIDGDKSLMTCQSCQKVYANLRSQDVIKSIELIGNDNVQIQLQGNVDLVTAEKTLKRKDPLNILSIFKLKSYENERPYFYFINYRGTHYTLELSGKNLFMRLNGQLINTFEKVGP